MYSRALLYLQLFAAHFSDNLFGEELDEFSGERSVIENNIAMFLEIFKTIILPEGVTDCTNISFHSLGCGSKALAGFSINLVKNITQPGFVLDDQLNTVF